MLLDNLYSGTTFQGKRVGVTPSISPTGNSDERVDIAAATRNLQNSLTVSQESILESINSANNMIRRSANGDNKLYERNKINLRSEKERLEALKIKTDAIKAFMKSYYAEASGLLPDDKGNRYVCAHCMKNEFPLTAADKLHNERIAYLVEQAEAGAYKDLETKKPVPPNPAEDGYVEKMRKYDQDMKDYAKLLHEKNQLMQAHVDMFKKLRKSDVNKLMNHEYTDRELADEFEVFNESAAITGQIQNARQATEKWFGKGNGIDSNNEIKDILRVYEPMTSTYAYYKQRLGAIISPTYEYLDPISNSATLQSLFDIDAEDALTGESAKDAKNIQDHKLAIDYTIIEDVFKSAGMPCDRLSFVIDDQTVEQQDEMILNADSYSKVKGKPIIVFDRNNRDITMKFLPKDLPVILKGLTEGKSLEELFPAPQQAPEPVGWFGRLTDWFNDKLYGTKPKQEAYEAAVKEYNTRRQISEQLPVFKRLAQEKAERDRLAAEQRANLQNHDPQAEQNQVNLQNQGPQAEENRVNIQNRNPHAEENRVNIQNRNPQAEENIPEIPQNQENLPEIHENESDELGQRENLNKSGFQKEIDETENLHKQFDEMTDEINNLYDRINKTTGLKINTKSEVENGFEAFHYRFSENLRFANTQKNIRNIEKSIAGILLLGKLNEKLEDSVVTNNFNEVYDEIKNTLNVETLDKQAEQLANQPGFSEFIKNMDPERLNKLRDPEVAFKVGAYELKRFAMERKAIEDAKKENDALKNNQVENDNPNKEHGPVKENEDIKHLGNDSVINIGK